MCSASIASSSPSAFAVEATVKGIMSVKTLTDSLATSKLSSKRDSASKDRVTFDKVVIQEHAIIVGDNPACSGGAPISLDWEHTPMKEFSVDDFESGRPFQRHRSSLRMPASHRHQILMDEWEVSMTQIMKAAMEIRNIQEDRSKTARSFFRQERSREVLKSAGRKIVKMFRRKKVNSPWKRRTAELPTVASFRNLKECCNHSRETEEITVSSSYDVSEQECFVGYKLEEEMDYF